jgi:signal transduction histidine kinase
MVDSARLELVILNLVSNAIKYCDPDKADRTGSRRKRWRRQGVRD